MNIRARKHFRASGNSTIIAVIFSIASGASALAGGHSNIASNNMQHETSAPSWQQDNDENKSEQLLCRTNPDPASLGT